MPIQIDLTEQERRDFVKYYEDKQSRLLSELKEVEISLAKLNVNDPNNMNGSDNEASINTSSPARDVGWKNKIEEILREAGSSLYTREIISGIFSRYPDLDINKDSAMKSVSSLLSVNSRGDNPRYIQEANENGHTKYRLAE